MRGRWKPEIVPSTQLFYDINIMDNGLYTIFKNICSATFATDILNQCRLFYQSLGFDDVSKGEHCVTMTMSLGKFVQIFYRSMIHSLASLSSDDISFDGLSGVGSSHCFNPLLRRREIYFCLFDNLTS